MIEIEGTATLEKLQKLKEQLQNAPVVCSGCRHPAHRAYRCGVKVNQIGTPISGRKCNCNVTFELNS